MIFMIFYECRNYGDIVYNIDGNYIREGISLTGDIVYNIDGDYIREGISINGDIKYRIYDE